MSRPNKCVISHAENQEKEIRILKEKECGGRGGFQLGNSVQFFKMTQIFNLSLVNNT